MVLSSFEMYLDPDVTTNIFKVFAKPSHVWDYHVKVLVSWMVVMIVLSLDNALSIVAVGLETV